jgi:RNA polymerase sigma-70 factor (ECF subfamily)
MTARTSSVEATNELREALASNDAFDRWYRRTVPRVYSYVLSRCGGDSSLAEDLTQQTFLAAIDQRAAFDGRSEIVTWLCGIARHKLADHFRSIERQDRRRMELEVRQIQLEQDAVVRPGLDDRVAIAEALRSLPPADQAVLAFVVLDGLSVGEAGRLMHRSEGATRSLLHRARERFRQAYGGEIADD